MDAVTSVLRVVLNTGQNWWKACVSLKVGKSRSEVGILRFNDIKEKYTHSKNQICREIWFCPSNWVTRNSGFSSNWHRKVNVIWFEHPWIPDHSSINIFKSEKEINLLHLQHPSGKYGVCSITSTSKHLFVIISKHLLCTCHIPGVISRMMKELQLLAYTTAHSNTRFSTHWARPGTCNLIVPSQIRWRWELQELHF